MLKSSPRISKNISEKMRVYALVSLVFMLALWALWPSLRFEFVGDDALLIYENKYVRSLKYIFELFRQNFFYRDVLGLPVTGEIGYYRPLTKVSFALDWFIWGKNPFGFHFTQLLLHLAVGAGIFVFALRLHFCRAVAGAAAVLFVIWPAHAEALGLINARSDILCAGGILIALLGAIKMNPLVHGLGIGVALLSKETGVIVFPLSFLWLLSQKSDQKKWFRFSWVWLLTGTVYFVLRYSALGYLVSKSNAAQASLAFSVIDIGHTLALHYLALFNIATGNINWMIRETPYQWAWAILGFGLFITNGLAAVWAYYKRKAGAIALLLMWLPFFLLLNMNHINVPLAEVMVPLQLRWTYIPAMGLVLVLAKLFTHLKKPKLAVSLFIVLTVVCGARYRSNLEINQSQTAMGEHWLKKLQAVPYRNLPPALRAQRLSSEGIAAGMSGEMARAVEKLSQAWEILPNDAHIQGNLGSAYYAVGNYEKAKLMLEGSLKAKKSSDQTAVYLTNDAINRDRPRRFNLLGLVYLKLGEQSAAENAFKLAVEGDPENMVYLNHLASFYLLKKNYAEAFVYFRQAMKKNTCNRASFNGLNVIAHYGSSESMQKKAKKMMESCTK